MNSLFPNKGFTHGAVFHADDVFTTAFLKILNPEWNENLSADEVFDKAVEFAITILKAKFKHLRADREADNIIKAKLKDAEEIV